MIALFGFWLILSQYTMDMTKSPLQGISHMPSRSGAIKSFFTYQYDFELSIQFQTLELWGINATFYTSMPLTQSDFIRFFF